jgi:charged multivesicular body protein 2A
LTKQLQTHPSIHVCFVCSDAIVSQVLDELGLQMADQLTDLPSAGKTVAQPAAQGKQAVAAGPVSDADADLEARLENLKRL